MIVHQYGEWQEPEQPPFTVEDLVAAISDLMLRANVTLDEALKALLQQGLPLGQLLQLNGLDALLERLLSQTDAALQAEEAHQQASPPSTPQAQRAAQSLLSSMKRLRRQLRKAQEGGELFSLDVDLVRRLLGNRAADELTQKRDELQRAFDELLERSGQVDTSGGIYKLTPAAARSLGAVFLAEVFRDLVADGMGKHATRPADDGLLEGGTTRPYEPGDSLAHLDLPASLVNALLRDGSQLPIRVRSSDLEVYQTLGTARTSVVVLLDMSGSMERYDRFYNAKKVTLALDALMRSQFPEDRLHVVGFATFAQQYRMGDVVSLRPRPVTYAGSQVRLSVDFEALEDPARKALIPQYFTNTQKGLELARRLLSAEPTGNRHVILITDGVPTAYYLGPRLKLSYPPTRETFHETMREVHACKQAGITIHTFMMTSDWELDYHGERSFVEGVARISGGRLFYPDPDSLTKFVLRDFVQARKRMFSA